MHLTSYPTQLEIVNTLCGICVGWPDLVLAPLGSRETLVMPLVWLHGIMIGFPGFLLYWWLISCAGLFPPRTGCQHTVWDACRLARSRTGPSGVYRDTGDAPGLIA